MFDKDSPLDRALSAEARLATHKEATAAALDRIKDFKANFGVREKSSGELVVDYDRFAEAIGMEGALELRAIIDEKYNISGAAGEKPRIKVNAS